DRQRLGPALAPADGCVCDLFGQGFPARVECRANDACRRGATCGRLVGEIAANQFRRAPIQILGGRAANETFCGTLVAVDGRCTMATTVYFATNRVVTGAASDYRNYGNAIVSPTNPALMTYGTA